MVEIGHIRLLGIGRRHKVGRLLSNDSEEILIFAEWQCTDGESSTFTVTLCLFGIRCTLSVRRIIEKDGRFACSAKMYDSTWLALRGKQKD
jgi:hypothetical protein